MKSKRKIMNKNMNTYDYKITLKKFAVSALEVIIAGLIVLATENPTYMMLIPMFEGLRNLLKHRFGVRIL